MRVMFLLHLLFCMLAGNAHQISGTIKNPRPEQFLYFRFPASISEVKDSTAVSADGRFVKAFKLKEPQFVTLTYGRSSRQLYVFPNGKFQLSFDATNDSTFKHSFSVSGDHSINAYLSFSAQDQPQIGFLGGNIQMDQPIDSLAPVLKAFRRFADSLRMAYFNTAKLTTINKQLQAFLTIDSIDWNSYALLAAMDYSRIIAQGNKAKFWEEEISQRMPTNPAVLHFSAPYFKRLWLFYLRGAYDAQLRGPDSLHAKAAGFTRFALQKATTSRLNSRLEQSVIEQLMIDVLNMYTYRTLEENKVYDSLINEMKGMIKDDAFIDAFDKQYGQKRAILLAQKKGSKAPGFSLVDSSGKMYGLNDFAGKVILVDVWASWCMPCIREFPYLRKLQEQFRNDNRFQLLSVSIDATEGEWKTKGLRKHKPPGLGLWVGANNSFADDYYISLIPVLLLLDEQGNFIEFDPPRASEGDQLYQLIKDKVDKL